MSGKSRGLDPRVDAARRDLADIRLADHVFAPHYAAGMTHTAFSRTPILATPDPDAKTLSELLPGEEFALLETSGERAWGVAAVDGAVGYVDADAIGPVMAMTHIVTAPFASVYREASAGAASLGTLPMGARIAAIAAGDFVETGTGFVPAKAVRVLGAKATGDPADVAETLVGVPAKAGGRSGAGVDGAGLVFLCLDVAGIAAPRFRDLQAETVGTALAAHALLQRGDLVYFAEHVAIMIDGGHVVHVADDAVCRESLAVLCDAKAFGSIVARRRPAP